jgi:K+-transporting ATPase ATPase C chain
VTHVKRNLLIALRMTLLTLLVTGVVYPLAITGAAQLLFPRAANGSLVTQGDRVVGSHLVGQGFSSARYFHSRPSAAGAGGYDASASSASNLGPTSRTLIDDVTRRVDEVIATERGAQRGEIPVDMVTASGSGLDPDISPDAARLQVRRVAIERGLDEAAVRDLVEQHVKSRQFGLLGEARVNVLELNLALDALSSR